MACSWFRSRCEESPGEPHFQRVSRPPPCPWNMTVVLQCHPVYSDANSRFSHDFTSQAHLRHASIRATQPGGPVGRQPDQAASPAYAQQADNRVSLNFVDTDIPAVLRALSLFTQRNFLVDPRVKGKLTLVSDRPVDSNQALSMLTGALPAGLRHCRCGRRDPRGARSRRQAAGQRGGGRSASGGQGRAGVGVQLLRAARRRRRDADPRVPAQVRERRQPGAGAAPDGAAQQSGQRLSRQQHAGGHRLRRQPGAHRGGDRPHRRAQLHRHRRGAGALRHCVRHRRAGPQLLDTQGNDPTQRIAVVADPRSNSVLVRAGIPRAPSWRAN